MAHPIILSCVLIILSIFGPESLVSGGVCWSAVTANGRCKDLVQSSVSKEYCCQLAGGLAAWTEEDYDNGQAFFWHALGGGAPNCKTCSDSCNNIKCPDDEVCSMKNGQPVCGCPLHCPAPGPGTKAICGSTGQTFKSECHLKRYNCRKQTKIWADYEGHCQSSCDTVKCKADQHCILDKEHTPHCVRCQSRCLPLKTNPVCGTDAVTYDSLCHLHKFACENKEKNVKYAHRGGCDASTTCANARCSADETCILDSITRTPRCVRCDLNCSNSTESPVCGSDGITYTNWCQLRANSCVFGVLIHVDRIGSCNDNQTAIR
ncbi:follistatin-like [Paramacrobiotus metropolitanus]|uniref:follistatin-like n=1 Tax=Paramacrobiotus metropolitanus TaxID=2943436 RepID=UPI0024458895|nr:follistatin-like [Paramacrobiotus metropolitanus]